MSKEYTRLAQNERDLESTNYVVRPDEKRKRSCCFSTFVVFAIFLMLCGAIAIVIGIFYTPQVNHFIEYYMKHGNDSDIRQTPNITASQINEMHATAPALVTHEPLLPNDTKAETNTTKMNSTVTESSEDLDDEDEDEEETSTTSTKLPPKHHEKKHNSSENKTAHEPGLLEKITGHPEILDEAEEKFASWMIKLERFLETVTGIHRPEILVPLFMLLCFFISLALASCCCCLMMKRREIRRRRILGKIITDLQTGDSKSILLDQDGDD